MTDQPERPASAVSRPDETATLPPLTQGDGPTWTGGLPASLPADFGRYRLLKNWVVSQFGPVRPENLAVGGQTETLLNTGRDERPTTVAVPIPAPPDPSILVPRPPGLPDGPSPLAPPRP